MVTEHQITRSTDGRNKANKIRCPINKQEGGGNMIKIAICDVSYADAEMIEASLLRLRLAKAAGCQLKNPIWSTGGITLTKY